MTHKRSQITPQKEKSLKKNKKKETRRRLDAIDNHYEWFPLKKNLH